MADEQKSAGRKSNLIYLFLRGNDIYLTPASIPLIYKLL